MRRGTGDAGGRVAGLRRALRDWAGEAKQAERSVGERAELGDAGERAALLRQWVRWAARVWAGPGREKAGLALERRKGGPRLGLLG